ncbi:MAG: hypothetical protein J5758_05780 [Abditibacteriota bacterium]|nr:hypothetical protein [Abditibacteriota bacterium]
MIKGDLIAPVRDLLRICLGLIIIGAVIFALIFSLLFSAGFAIGCGLCVLDVWMLAYMVSRLTAEDGIGARYVLLFAGKTFVLLGVLALCVFLLSRLSMPMFWGFICGLLLIPVGSVLLVIVNLIRKKVTL